MSESSFPIECFNRIFKHIENDKSTLHSCLLVDRLWCRMIVPILWSRSFSLIQNSKKDDSLFPTGTYLTFLNDEERQLYNHYPELYPTAKFEEHLFNYPSFLKDFHYDLIVMYLIVKFWVKTNTSLDISKYNCRIINTISNKISQSLFKMFLRNNAQINLMNIKSFEFYPDLPFLSNLQNSFSDLKSFQFSSYLEPLHKKDDKEELFFNIINAQRNIKKFIINPHGIIPRSILNSIIHQTSLVLVHFKETKFINWFPFELLLNCDNLKFLLTENCHEYCNEENSQSDTVKPCSISLKDIKCKVDTLYINNNNFLPLTISKLIQLSGTNLTSLWLDRTKFSSYIITSEPLSIHCPNITHLILTIDTISLYQIKNSLSILISNLNLEYFGIRNFGWTNELISDLGNYLPSSLKYLEISSFFDFEALYMLLKSCKCQLRGLSMIFFNVFNENYLSFIIDYAKCIEGGNEYQDC
ncbi:15404_t:CDS:2 [Funneliformis geosporum]|uniref:15404_t:CDS:1 n=1 Tax=Funneliformis geosporum TaxID=1117311 RepID=A0A9W4SEQ3_9GLOM|nr:15404_t:CDS:2 [Funneliformis geosporum]